MNTEVMFSSKTGLWETPQDLFDKLDEEFHFTLDVCALPENAKCERYYTPEMDGLSQRWDGVCWCNPPYGRDVWKWVAAGQVASVMGSTVVMLLPARTDTRWFHDWIYGKAEVRFIRGRLKFGGRRTGAPFPSMVVIFRPVVDETDPMDWSRVQQTTAKLDRSRWEGCPMCTAHYTKYDWNTYDVGAHEFRVSGSSLMYCDQLYGWEGIGIHFCPNCGRPLTEEAWAKLERRMNGGATDNE